jgi:hypothetical protein
MSKQPLEPAALAQVPFARRTFLSTALLATGAALTGVLARFVGGTHDARRVAADVAEGKAGAHTPTDADAWHVDDMWGHRPRYAHPIPHAGVALDPVSWDHVDPIDRPFVI